MSMKKKSPIQKFSQKNSKGFTLIEMIVSIGLFTIVMFIATSAFLAVVNADRKSRSVRIAADNLNLSLEDMQRRIKTGLNYYCGTSASLTMVLDCPGATSAISFSFLEQDGQTRTIYTYDPTAKAIYRESSGVSVLYYPGEKVRVTAPEISINSVKFIVKGSTPGVIADGGDSVQAYVTIVINGSIAGATPTNFNIQTMITQRNYDS